MKRKANTETMLRGCAYSALVKNYLTHDAASCNLHLKTRKLKGRQRDPKEHRSRALALRLIARRRVSKSPNPVSLRGPQTKPACLQVPAEQPRARPLGAAHQSQLDNIMLCQSSVDLRRCMWGFGSPVFALPYHVDTELQGVTESSEQRIQRCVVKMAKNCTRPVVKCSVGRKPAGSSQASPS